MNRLRMPMLKQNRIFILSLLVTAMLFPVAVQAQPERRVDDTLTYPTDTIMMDSLMVDSLLPDTTDELHPLMWDYVNQDEKIAWLLQAHRHAMSRQPGIQGYRVHLYMDSGNRARLNTQREMAEFMEKHPDVNAYIVYEEPYFKLRAGDFRTRVDARRFLEKIRRDYTAAYIVVDRINFPELD